MCSITIVVFRVSKERGKGDGQKDSASEVEPYATGCDEIALVARNSHSQ